MIEPINTNIKPIRKKFIKKKREHTIEQINDLLLDDVYSNRYILLMELNYFERALIYLKDSVKKSGFR